MRILGIESSCDDTSVALLMADERDFVVERMKTASQVDVHKAFGGVVPEIAGRMHAETIMPVIEAVLDGQKKPDVIAATTGPGLITGLLVGAEAGKALSYLWEIPFVSVNHIAGHIHSVLLGPEGEKKNHSIEFPALGLIVSGGHTELMLMHDHHTYELLGKTRDDAAGEAFDKVGKLLGFDYPGGPIISKHAAKGNPYAISFPRPMLDKDNYDFSFAGLKTAALYWLRDNTPAAEHANPFAKMAAWFGQAGGNDITTNDFCASFEQAIIHVLAEKTARAAEDFQPKTVILGGGVSANKKLRDTLKSTITTAPLLIPDLAYTMDNGAMIAAAGYFKARDQRYTRWQEILVDPNAKAYE